MATAQFKLCGVSWQHNRYLSQQKSKRASRQCIRASEGEKLLKISGLEAKVEGTDTKILNGIDLSVGLGEVHAIMGKNGSGKSTLSKCLVGHPAYEIMGGTVTYKEKDLLEMEPEERSHEGLFLSFQSPIEVPGVSNVDFLRMAANASRKAKGQPEMEPIEFYSFVTPILQKLNMDPVKFLNRNVNEGFSGGEKKRNEILQLAVLDAELAILDEIDSGLDVDALKDVAEAITALKSPTKSVMIITHYQRLLDFVQPDFVHIMEAGRIIKSGGPEIAQEIEKGGYAAVA